MLRRPPAGGQAARAMAIGELMLRPIWVAPIGRNIQQHLGHQK
jgi:hypothetical protein